MAGCTASRWPLHSPSQPFPVVITKSVHHRLNSIVEELSGVREEARVLAEQLAFSREVMDEARIRALVAETPLADRELRIASDDVGRMERGLAELDGRVRMLLEERDRLLGEVARREPA